MATSSKPHHGNNSRRSESDIDETITAILVGLAKAVAVLAWCSVLFPMISIPTLASVWVGVWFGPVFGLILAVLSGLGLAAWSQLSPPSFQRCVTLRMRIQWRLWWVYRYRWTAICTLHGLTALLEDRTLVPSLCSVSIGASSDVVAVRILTGQSLADWQSRSAALAEALGAYRVTVHSIRPGTISITAHHADPLATPIRLRYPVPTAHVDLSNIRVGVTEAGTWWRLPVLGQHILVAGATGSGKGSVLWSIIAALAPGVRAGSMRLLVVDPKGGMEFGLYPGLFWHLACETDAEMVEALELAADLVQVRAKELRGVARQHVPTIAEPFYLVVVDEIASLTAYLGDRQLRDRAKLALGRLLTKGRAPGVSVVGCVQDPRKDVLELRNLFTTRIALRLAEKTEVAMVLGDGARDRGAYADRIPLSAPGIGYVIEDGSPTVTKVRAGFVDDDQLAWLADTYPTPSRLVPDVIDGEIIDDQPEDAPAPQSRSKARR